LFGRGISVSASAAFSAAAMPFFEVFFRRTFLGHIAYLFAAILFPSKFRRCSSVLVSFPFIYPAELRGGIADFDENSVVALL
jgi:hypothetical protein